MQIHTYDSNTEASAALAQQVATKLAAALAEKGSATLAVSGGSTPQLFFNALAQADVEWAHVAVTLVDERWVAPDHADSNEALVRRHLLRDRAAQATFVGLKTPALTAVDAQAEVHNRLQQWGAKGIDVVVLGMGEDGHTASVFPGRATFEQGFGARSHLMCAALSPQKLPQNAPYERMTLTLNTLLQARSTYLQIVGPQKLQVLRVAQAPGPEFELPVRAMLQRAQPPVEIYYADRK